MRLPRRQGMRWSMRKFLLMLVALLVAATAGARGDQWPAGPTPLTDEMTPPPIPAWVNDDKKRVRNYPEQPPIIPHSIEAYQITSNANKCLSCHARQFTEPVGRADDQRHAFHGPQRPGARLGFAAALFLHAVPCAATGCRPARRKPLHRRRFPDQSPPRPELRTAAHEESSSPVAAGLDHPVAAEPATSAWAS